MKKLLTALVLVAPAAAFADPGHRGGHAPRHDDTVDISGYAGGSFLSIDDGIDKVDPNGSDVGVRAKVFLGSGLFLGGEYTYSDTETTFAGSKARYQVDEYRLGGGVLLPVSPYFKLGGYGHYVNQQVQLDFQGFGFQQEADGYDVGVLAQFDASRRLQAYGRVGYISLEPQDSNGNGSGSRLDGVDLLIGASYSLTRNLALFGEYRYTQLDDGSTSTDLSAVRGGVRLRF